MPSIPRSFLSRPLSGARLRCLGWGQCTGRRGVRLVVWYVTRHGGISQDVRTLDPVQGRPWCTVCAYTGWGVDVTKEPHADALASGWNYLGIPITSPRLRLRTDDRGLAYRWRTHHT